MLDTRADVNWSPVSNLNVTQEEHDELQLLGWQADVMDEIIHSMFDM